MMQYWHAACTFVVEGYLHPRYADDDEVQLW